MNSLSNSAANISQATRDAVGTPGGNSVIQVTAPVRNQFTTDDQRRAGTFYEVFTTAPAFYFSITTKFNGTVSSG